MGHDSRSNFGDYHDIIATLLIGQSEGNRGNTEEALTMLYPLYVYVEKTCDPRQEELVHLIQNVIDDVERKSMTVNSSLLQLRPVSLQKSHREASHVPRAL